MASRPSGESTGKSTASAASKVLRDPKASKEARTAAASALTQTGSKTGEKTSAKVAAAASKVLRDPKSSKEARSVAASALTQAADKPKVAAKAGHLTQRQARWAVKNYLAKAK